MQAFNPKNRVHEQPPFCAVLIKNAQKTKNIQNINLMVSKINSIRKNRCFVLIDQRVFQN
jgi:hypothetical protein